MTIVLEREANEETLNEKLDKIEDMSQELTRQERALEDAQNELEQSQKDLEEAQERQNMMLEQFELTLTKAKQKEKNCVGIFLKKSKKAKKRRVGLNLPGVSFVLP